MWTHTNNSDIRYENSIYVFNAYFVKDDGTECNTGLGFNHNPTQAEIDAAVVEFQATL